jgi:peptide/nickel transport system substrate-binding protein
VRQARRLRKPVRATLGDSSGFADRNPCRRFPLGGGSQHRSAGPAEDPGDRTTAARSSGEGSYAIGGKVSEKRSGGGVSRRRFLQAGGAGVAGVALGSLAACGGTQAPSGRSSRRARFLIAENFWANWEPYQSNAQSQARINQHMYDYLVEFPQGNRREPSPGLASSWRQLDARTWQFKLRRGVRFHDGSPFDPEDVKASLELASGATGTKTVTSGQWVPTRVEVVDSSTVRLVTEEPFGPLFSSLGETPIVSAGDLTGSAQALRNNPNGTGPFRLVDQTRTKKVMEANSRYWRDPAAIKELIWEFVQDPQTRLNALLAGQADAIDRVPPEHFQQIESSPDVTKVSVTGLENVNLWVLPGRFPAWDRSREFRQAIAWSVDRASLTANLVQGASAVSTSHLPEKALFHEPQSPEYSLDENKAKDLLSAAGVSDQDLQFELWVTTGFLPRSKQVVESIEATMREVGLQPKIVTTDVAGITDDIFSEGGTGAMYHLSWSSNGDPSTVMPVFDVWLPDDQRVNALRAKGQASIRASERGRFYAQFQAYMWDQMLSGLPLYNSDFTIAHTRKLEGLLVRPDFFTYFYPARMTG